MKEKTALERAMDAVGGMTRLAGALGVTAQVVSNWKARPGGMAPARYCAQIEALTGVPRQELRDDWRDFWPELETRKAGGA